ncbi:MAG: YitT family protein, partial [Butyricicoccus sp.]|nr:YitT family protein [Butyricicoccus sp.]
MTAKTPSAAAPKTRQHPTCAVPRIGNDADKPAFSPPSPRGRHFYWKGSVTVFQTIRRRSCLIALLGSAILAFGLYNIHALSHVTEGGGLGLTLLLHHWFDISPAVSGFVFNVLCYILGFRVMGR